MSKLAGAVHGFIISIPRFPKLTRKENHYENLALMMKLMFVICSLSARGKSNGVN